MMDDAHIDYSKKKAGSNMTKEELSDLKAINSEIAANLADNIKKAEAKKALRKEKEESQQE